VKRVACCALHANSTVRAATAAPRLVWPVQAQLGRTAALYRARVKASCAAVLAQPGGLNDTSAAHTTTILHAGTSRMLAGPQLRVGVQVMACPLQAVEDWPTGSWDRGSCVRGQAHVRDTASGVPGYGVCWHAIHVNLKPLHAYKQHFTGRLSTLEAQDSGAAEGPHWIANALLMKALGS
jgi:hypothetical protein